LVDVGISYVESAVPEATTDVLDQIRHAFNRFLIGDMTLEDCQQVMMVTIQRDGPLMRLHEIMSVTDQPLPVPSDPSANSSELSLRRRTRPWSNIEDRRLLAGIHRYGLDNWQSVAKFVGSGRNRAQCSQRWFRGLNPRISKKGWTLAEDEQLRALVQRYGEKSWARIASIMGNRSDVQCRYHYVYPGHPEPDDSHLKLARGSPATKSSECLGSVMFSLPAPPKVEAYKQIALQESRQSLSSPILELRPRQVSHGQLLLPLSPLTNRSRGSELPIRRFEPRTTGWGVCGADEKSLEVFLGNFL
jgi:hypothetical protein